MTNRPTITQENILLGAKKAAENIIYFDKVEAYDLFSLSTD